MKPKTRSKKIARKARPKDIWNALRKLEGHLKKADIQAGVFMDSLEELRGVIAFDVRREIVQGLCSSVNGDILHELLEHQRRVDEGVIGVSVEHNAILSGIFDCLRTTLAISPHREPGERIRIRREDAREYSFEAYPASLDDEKMEKLTVEVLRAGWKVQDKVVVKPTVCEVVCEEATDKGQSATGLETVPPAEMAVGRS